MRAPWRAPVLSWAPGDESPCTRRGTFAVFAMVGGKSMGPPPRTSATGLAIGILLDTFAVRTLFVPAAVVLLGQRNWWPSRLSHLTPDQPVGVIEQEMAARPGAASLLWRPGHAVNRAGTGFAR